MKDRTRVVHRPPVNGAGFASLTVPIHRASTIVFDSAQAYADRKTRGPDGYSYGLHGTPTTKALEAQLSALEGAERTAILPSGQSAIALLFLTVLQPGDTVLIPDNAYPPVRELCAGFLGLHGIGHRIYDPMIGADIASIIDDRTRLVWTESPGSATMEVSDIPAIVAAARNRGVLTGCDNTWATPLLFKPLAIGMDFSMEAITKYLGGHSDILLGSVSVRDKQWYYRLKDVMRLLGIGVSPDDCALALRGIETLGLRLAHIGRVAAEFARRLQDHPAIADVLHPALPHCLGHEVWRRDFAGSSGVFSLIFREDLDPRLDEALSRLKTFAIGASWGGTHSLVAPMSVTGDRTVDRWKHKGRMLRISIGLEDEEDLWDDIAGLCDHLVEAGASGG